jgi:RNA polymerase sigma factor (sigma-70 family)
MSTLTNSGPVPPYRVKARIQNNRLWRAIERALPGVRTQADAARQLGVSPQALCSWLTMRCWPRNRRGGWAPMAQHVADALTETPEYLFEAALYSKQPRPELVLEMGPKALADLGLLALPPAPDEEIEREEQKAAVHRLLETIPEWEANVLRARFDLDDAGEEWTHRQIAEEAGITKAAVYQAEGRALRKLRHPSRLKKLREYVLEK